MTGQAMDANATGGSTQCSLGSTPYTTSNTSQNVAADNQSETSIESEHQGHSKAKTVNFSSENGIHSPRMAPKDLESSVEEGVGNKLKNLTVADLRDSLSQIIKMLIWIVISMMRTGRMVWALALVVVHASS